MLGGSVEVWGEVRGSVKGGVGKCIGVYRKVRGDVGMGVGKCVGVWGEVRGECGGCGKCVGVSGEIRDVGCVGKCAGVWGEVKVEVWGSVLGFGRGKGRCGKVCWGSPYLLPHISHHFPQTPTDFPTPVNPVGIIEVW